GPGFTLTITGTGFISSSVVRWNGSDRSTTFVSSTRLTASIPASDIATAGPAYVTVFNPGPGGGTSDPVTFNIQSTNPQPTISSVTPEVIPVGNSDVALTVTGSNFVANSVVRWNGTPLTTTFVSATELRANCPGSATRRRRRWKRYSLQPGARRWRIECRDGPGALPGDAAARYAVTGRADPGCGPLRPALMECW
ncbi:MAG: IPT/TIG domain-containing protein, partial [Roseiflexaceae bacterium]|nr:IPT/TIG domain-containing protein [Roseiflexaceae bacterium]